MKELSIEEKAKRYDEAIRKAHKLCAYPTTKPFISDLQDIFPELKESEGDKIRKKIIATIHLYYGEPLEDEAKEMIAWLKNQDEQKPIEEYNITGISSKHAEGKLGEMIENMESANNVEPKDYSSIDQHFFKPADKIEKQPSQWNISDYRTWQYIVSDVLTKHDGIGQYLDDGECKKIAKYMQEEWSKRLSVEQRTTELPKGEDYGIDGLYAAIDILQKTLGEVDGYQSDDGILEHECAISAVKELSKQQKPAWSEEDEETLKDIITSMTNLKDSATSDALRDIYNSKIDWLKSLRPQNTWKPSDEQLVALRIAIGDEQGSDCCDILRSLLKDLKSL